MIKREIARMICKNNKYLSFFVMLSPLVLIKYIVKSCISIQNFTLCKKGKFMESVKKVIKWVVFVFGALFVLLVIVLKSWLMSQNASIAKTIGEKQAKNSNSFRWG
jgi:hypothetical protein